VHTLYPKITTSPRRVEDVSEIEIDRPSVTLIKVHGIAKVEHLFTYLYLHTLIIGAFMMFTWYFLAPVGIFLALFYKESFPNGLWFYVRHTSIHYFVIKYCVISVRVTLQ